MANPVSATVPPGNSVLGGASAGLTYEGALHDAAAEEDRCRRREARRHRMVPPPQTQAAAPDRVLAEPGVRPGQTPQ